MYKGKGWGQIFGLFKGTYFMDRPLEQKVIKQRLRHNKIMGVKLLSAVDLSILGAHNFGAQIKGLVNYCHWQKENHL